MSDSPYAAEESSHDSFRASQHVNWLINSAGLGVFAHGRVHQEGDHAIFVGDMLHKRGIFATDDVLKMEEQALDGMGDPLTVRSSLGNLKAMALLPAMGTAHGEGDIIGYYEGGVVSFDTFKAPRETRVDGEGTVIQKGWDFERLVNYLLNTVSAVGPNAVTVMPRDHFFRSVYGLHFLKTVMGDGTFKPENLNTISPDLQPVLLADPDHALEGAATGMWLRGTRLFASVGLHESSLHAAVSLARGFVSLNQATTFTADQTPRPAAEGVWVLDSDMQGLHQFVELGLRPESGCYGFLASDRDADLYFATIVPGMEEDFRCGDAIPIEWSLETGCFYGAKDGQKKKLTEGILEGMFTECSGFVRVLVRTDMAPQWAVWHEFKPCDKHREPGEKFIRNEPIGQPPASHREGTWFQFRIEGLGYAEIIDLRYGIGDAGSKSGQSRCVAVGSCEEDLFITNREPAQKRWPTL